jgi:hypothetical protein
MGLLGIRFKRLAIYGYEIRLSIDLDSNAFSDACAIKYIVVFNLRRNCFDRCKDSPDTSLHNETVLHCPVS